MKVAFVHDWLVTYRGGEKVLEALLELYPGAPVYTLFYRPEGLPESLTSREVIAPKWLQGCWKAKALLLPLFPAIIEAFPLEDYDLVISTSSCVAKGAMVGPSALHVSYIHSPMRYIWDQRRHYVESKPWFMKPIIHWLSQKLRVWDMTSSVRVGKFIANSGFVARRVRAYYGRDAFVLPPPINVPEKRPDKPSLGERYFIVAGAFVAYKGFDLAIRSCQAAGKKLVVAGSGPDEARLRQLAGRETRWYISPNDDEFQSLISGADALLFPGIEDFGMIAIEAMAQGTPVIARRGGGALDFIQEGETGCFFSGCPGDDLKDVIESFDPDSYSPEVLRTFALGYSKESFQKSFQGIVDKALGELG